MDVAGNGAESGEIKTYIKHDETTNYNAVSDGFLLVFQ